MSGTTWVMYFDGHCEAGVACYAFAVLLEGGLSRHVMGVARGFVAEGEAASGELAQLAGLVRGFDWLLAARERPERVLVCGDAEVARSWCSVAEAGLDPLLERGRARAREQVKKLHALGVEVDVTRVPFDDNSLARGEALRAWRERTGKEPKE